MEKHIYNEQTGISYTLHGDYYLPDLAFPDEEKGIEIGVWGQRRLRYIKQHRKVLYLKEITTSYQKCLIFLVFQGIWGFSFCLLKANPQ